tara:strand:+ start:1538 stop:1837 length:300 start_codon:yes stop_codon:yes gene_type:complete
LEKKINLGDYEKFLTQAETLSGKKQNALRSPESQVMYFLELARMELLHNGLQEIVNELRNIRETFEKPSSSQKPNNVSTLYPEEDIEETVFIMNKESNG